jgi:hypothetical protein
MGARRAPAINHRLIPTARQDGARFHWDLPFWGSQSAREYVVARILNGSPGHNNGSSSLEPESERIASRCKGKMAMRHSGRMVALASVMTALGLATDASAQLPQVEQSTQIGSAAAVRSETFLSTVRF